MKTSVLSHDTVLDRMFLFVTGNLVTDSRFKTLPSKMFRCVNYTLNTQCGVLYCGEARPVTLEARTVPWVCRGGKLSARVSLYSVLRWSHVSNVTHWFLRVSIRQSDVESPNLNLIKCGNIFSIYLRVIAMSKHAHTHTSTVQYT